MTKKNNHLLPRFIINKWKEKDGKIFNKKTQESRSIKYLDYSEEYYYSMGKVDDELENKISIFEGYISKLLSDIEKQGNIINISIKDMEILKLYVVLQSCRNENTSPVITFDESGIYQNNHYLTGVHLLSKQEDVIKFTNFVCDEFQRLVHCNNSSNYNVDYHFMNSESLNSFLTWGQHLVIVYNNTNSFIISETTAIIECSIDSDYMFTYTPISPRFGLILAKSKYFYSKKEIINTKIRFGYKYGNGFPDEYLSDVIDDYKLIFNGRINDNVNLNLVELNEIEIYKLNSIIYEDGNNILYSNEDFLNATKNPLNRKIVLLL